MQKDSADYKAAMEKMDKSIQSFRNEHFSYKRLTVFTKHPREDYFITNFRVLSWEDKNMSYTINLSPIDYAEDDINFWKVSTSVSYSTSHNYFRLEKCFHNNIYI